MKKWVLLIILIAAVAAVILLKGNWQVVSMFVAGLTAPFRFLFGLFGGDNEEKIRKKHAEIREREKQYQKELGAGIQGREKKVIDLEDKISELNEKLAALDEKRAKIDQEVESMTLEELQLAGRQYFGS